MMTRAANVASKSQSSPLLKSGVVWLILTATKSNSAELKAAAEQLWRRSTYMLGLYRMELFYRNWWLTSHSLWYFYPLSLEYMETRAGQWVYTALVFILHQKLS